MENYLISPNCNTTISNDPLIEATARKEDSGARAITCDCGEKITFLAITTNNENKTRATRDSKIGFKTYSTVADNQSWR